MIALIRYHLSLLLRSHRWIPAGAVYALAVAGLGVGGPSAGHGAALPQGLSWSALMLVPAIAWLSRSVLTAEPPSARDVVAAAGGPRRAQLSALAAALGMAGLLGLAGFGWEVASCGVVRSPVTNTVMVGPTVADLGHGLVAGLTCLLVGSAIGASCSPPVIRRPAAGMLASTAAVVLSLVWSVSPANAAVRPGYGAVRGAWPPGLPLIAAVALLALAWSISALVAARRGG